MSGFFISCRLIRPHCSFRERASGRGSTRRFRLAAHVDTVGNCPWRASFDRQNAINRQDSYSNRKPGFGSRSYLPGEGADEHSASVGRPSSTDARVWLRAVQRPRCANRRRWCRIPYHEVANVVLSAHRATELNRDLPGVGEACSFTNMNVFRGSFGPELYRITSCFEWACSTVVAFPPIRCRSYIPSGVGFSGGTTVDVVPPAVR